MAQQEDLPYFQRGVNVWNQWREEHPQIFPDLSDINLRHANLRHANLRSADLSRANLRSADLSRACLSHAKLNGADLCFARLRWAELGRADLSYAELRDINLSGANLHYANLYHTDLNRADLSGANLSDTNLSDTNLSGANLSDTNLSGAKLIKANLSGANLSGANLHHADLHHADLRHADLSKADFQYVKMDDTFFGDRDFRDIYGLETIHHNGPSPLSINSIYLSEGNIPEAFLRGTGASGSFIEYMHSLVARPIEYYTCFISYSTQDQDFAKRLYADLQQEGVRCWFAPEDLRIGDKFRQRIDESIRVHDKLLLVLSEHSVKSPWVEKEVETAFEEELTQDKLVLFPIKLDETVMKADCAWAADIRRMRHIGDFTHWKEHDAYQKGLARLLRDLKTS